MDTTLNMGRVRYGQVNTHAKILVGLQILFPSNAPFISAQGWRTIAFQNAYLYIQKISACKYNNVF